MRVLDKCDQLEGSHDFQSWFLDIKTAVQIISCDILLTNEHPPWATGTRTAAANPQTREWNKAQGQVRGLILSKLSREIRQSLSEVPTVFEMVGELRQRFTRKGGSRVAEIHAALRATTLETSKDIYDFASKIRQYNIELGSIYKDYTLRKWELNLHFVDNLTDAYDNFTERLLTSDRDFIEIGREMDWQDLVNKAAEVELKARVRGTRTSAFKATTSSCCSSPNCSIVHANVADSADTNSALEAAKKALNEARKKCWCEFYKIFGHLTKECWKAGNAPVPTHIKKRRANNNNNGANKKPRGDNNSNKP